MIRVLIVDDSAVIRQALRRELERHPDIEVVGAAADPYAARELIALHAPDVLTLDIDMPRMDGLSFLRALMRHHPLPVVVVSSIAPASSDTAMRALAMGAVDVVCKAAGRSLGHANARRALIRAVRAAGMARLTDDVPASPLDQRLIDDAPASPLDRRLTDDVPASPLDQRLIDDAPASPLDQRLTDDAPASPLDQRMSGLAPGREVVALGASTGGTRAIAAILAAFPSNAPAMLIVQHLPPGFTAAFAERLDRQSSLEVREARDGDLLRRGLALVAPGNRHMVVRREPFGLRVRLGSGPLIHHQRPSVDVLFASLAAAAAPSSAAALLTGMGRDGADGLLALRTGGAFTVAQDAHTSVVFGMPREAIARQAASVVAPLSEVAGLLLRGRVGDPVGSAAGPPTRRVLPS